MINLISFDCNSGGNLGNGDYESLELWTQKSKRYLAKVRGMDNVVRARLEAFIAFSHVAQYVQDSIFDPINLDKELQLFFFE
mgnify:CR=1 FL=1